MLILALCPMAWAQAMGRGISKYTRGQSDPRTCLAFFEEYLQGIEAPDDCRLEGRCECATQGRAQIDGTRLISPFGVHSINCTFHPYGEHSLADIEEMQTAEVSTVYTFCTFLALFCLKMRVLDGMRGCSMLLGEVSRKVFFVENLVNFGIFFEDVGMSAFCQW